MLITDKMIEDIVSAARIIGITKEIITTPSIKKALKQEGYEIQEKKTALEDARERADEITKIIDNQYLLTHDMQKVLKRAFIAYEKAVEEIQNKNN